jgi:hypothetical protein
MDPRDVTVWSGIPVTTVPRTLVTLAASLSPEALARACHEAGVRHRTTPEQVEAVLARRPTTPGAGALREVLHRRYTWADVYEEPAAMLRELRGLLQGSISPRRIA